MSLAWPSIFSLWASSRAASCSAFQMGFTMIQFADPLSGNQVGPTAFFIWMVSLLTFLVLDGHLYMIRGFAESFRIIPPGDLFIGENILWEVLSLSSQIFIIAIKIAAPVMVALFTVEVALGLVARTSPQVHIMEFGFPIKIAVGFFFVGLLLIIMGQQIGIFVGGITPFSPICSRHEQAFSVKEGDHADQVAGGSVKRHRVKQKWPCGHFCKFVM